MKKLITSIFAIGFLSTNAFALDAIQLKMQVVNLLSEGQKQGLVKQKYASDEAKIEGLINAGQTVEAETEIKKLITKISTDIVAGQVTADELKRRFMVTKKSLLPAHVAEINLYVNGGITAADLVDTLSPSNQYYESLVKLLQYFQQLVDSGRIQPAPANLSTIKPGVKDSKSILYARHRLSILGYQNDVNNPTLTQELASAITEFQANHNLEADGALGPASWKVLNQDIPAVISKIRINIDRSRWLPDHLGNEHVYVNLAEQKLKLIQNNQLTMSFKTINGRVDRQTPILFDKMSYLLINPTWTVPESILLKDKVPQFIENPQKVIDLRMKVIDDVTDLEVDPFTVDWTKLNTRYVPYTLVQQPGKHNALGFIKFPLTNPFAIYLHDTDSRDLFTKDSRLLSSGCVRLEKPFEFAERLVSAEWNADRLRNASEYLFPEATASTRVKFTKTIPVYLFYLTASVTEDGKVVLSNDAYGLDQLTYRILSGH